MKKFAVSSIFLAVISALFLLWSAGCRKDRGQKVEKKAPPKVQKKEEVGGIKPSDQRYIRHKFKVLPKEVVIRGGEFIRGIKRPERESEKAASPAHTVTLNYIYAIWKYEITQKEFIELMGYNPSHFKKCGPNCPVESVSWHEAANFANQLSRVYKLTPCYTCLGRGKTIVCRVPPRFEGSDYLRCDGFRLPTEAEWEFAARAGSKDSYLRLYEVPKKYRALLESQTKNPLRAVVDFLAWHSDNCFANYPGAEKCFNRFTDRTCGIQPVGKKIPNNWGIYDLLGNVSEWVYDRYSPYLPVAQLNPVGPNAGRRVFRGCSWLHPSTECFIQARYYSSPAFRSYGLGFRVARTILFSSKIYH